jgi:hypothetical protein
VNHHYAVTAVFPPHWLHDRSVRERVVLSPLCHTAERIDDFPRDRRWHIGNIRYGAMIVPHDPLTSCYGAHPLAGRVVPASQLDKLLDEVALATEAGEINHLGSWAIMVCGDVVFDV